MMIINPFLDTNVIISYLFKYEPEHHLTTSLFGDKSYFSENVNREVNYIFKEKKKMILSLFNSLIDILEESQEKKFSFNNFRNLITGNVERIKFKNNELNEKELTFILKEFWINEFGQNELKTNIILKVREYLLQIKTKLFKEKNKLLNELIMIKSHKNNHVKVEKKFLTYDSKNYADLKIILDVYEEYLKSNIKFSFVTFDKRLIQTLKKCDFNFIRKIISKRELN